MALLNRTSDLLKNLRTSLPSLTGAPFATGAAQAARRHPKTAMALGLAAVAGVIAGGILGYRKERNELGSSAKMRKARNRRGRRAHGSALRAVV